VISSFAVAARAFAAGICVDHSTKGGSITGRQLGCKEETVLGQFHVELILHDSRLHANPPLVGIDLEYAVHMLRYVADQSVGQRLAVGAGPAATRTKHDVVKLWLVAQACDQYEVVDILGIN